MQAPYRDGTTHVVFELFGIEIETCEQCGHLASRELPAGSRPPSRGPPQGELELP